MELTIHARLEEELFYPALREALQDDELLDEAEDQHGSQREFVAQILASSPQDELYDARVAVLEEYVERHVRKEREEAVAEVDQDAGVVIRFGRNRLAVELALEDHQEVLELEGGSILGLGQKNATIIRSVVDEVDQIEIPQAITWGHRTFQVGAYHSSYHFDRGVGFRILP